MARAAAARQSEPKPATVNVSWPLPWLLPTWARLWQAHRDDRLGHALLICGPAGLGKRLLADRLAKALMCQAPGDAGDPCGQCADCRLVAAGSHPDIVHLVPDPTAKSREIKAEQVRDLCGHQAMTPHRGRRKVLQIVPAEAMNLVAANGLLKTLEEPVASTLWLLVSEAPGRLTQTIRSRCQRIWLPTPPPAVALPWLRARIADPQADPALLLQLAPIADAQADPALLLQLAHGAPLAALALVGSEQLALRTAAFAGFVAVARAEQDPIAVADAWQRQEPAVVLGGLATWVCDLLRLRADPNAGHLDNPDQRAVLARLAAGIAPAAAHRYLQWVLRAQTFTDATVNKQMLYESLLVCWARLARREGRDGR